MALRPSEATEAVEATYISCKLTNYMFSFYHHHTDTDLPENQLHKSANEENSLILSENLRLA